MLEGVLRDGDPVALFPEGTRVEGPAVAPLFDGAAYLAVKLGVPIVPVGVGGTEHILPKGRSLPKIHKVVVVVGEPIEPESLESGGSRRAAATEDHGTIGRASLQACFDEALQSRRLSRLGSTGARGPRSTQETAANQPTRSDGELPAAACRAQQRARDRVVDRGLLFFTWIGAVLAIVFGHIARRQIARLERLAARRRHGTGGLGARVRRRGAARWSS